MKKNRTFLFSVYVFFLIISIFISINSSSASDGIVFKKNYEKSNEETKQIIHIDCGGNRDIVLIKENEPSLLFIPQNYIRNILIGRDFCNFYQPFFIAIEIDSSYSKKLNEISTEYYRKRVAFFINDELVSIPLIHDTDLKQPIFDISCFTLEKAVALSMNLEFLPDYNNICVNNKKKMKELGQYYKFKNKTQYKPLKDSTFWIVLKDTELFNNPEDKKSIKTLLQGLVW